MKGVGPRLRRAIYIGAGLVWAGILLDWALQGFDRGADGVFARLYLVSEKIGAAAGEVTTIVVLLSLLLAALAGILALVVVVPLAAVHGFRSVRRNATDRKGGH